MSANEKTVLVIGGTGAQGVPVVKGTCSFYHFKMLLIFGKH